MIITLGCTVTHMTHLVIDIFLCGLRFDPSFFYIRLLVTWPMGCLDLRLQAGIYNKTTSLCLHISHAGHACKKLCEHLSEILQSSCCTYMALGFML